jgi:hypothetical protein
MKSNLVTVSPKCQIVIPQSVRQTSDIKPGAKIPRAHHAELWTQDAHFDGLPGVRYFDKLSKA